MPALGEAVKELPRLPASDSIGQEVGMAGKARYLEADRAQLRWDAVDLDSQLPSDHRVRVVWAFVEQLNLLELYAGIGSVEGEAGRPPPDPKIFLALWLYATLEGVGSARQLDRLCERDVAYRWICGGVPMNYHGLSDFRFGHAAILDRLLTESLTALVAEGLVKLDEVAIDGTKVRASAGTNSFRSESKLAELESAAEARVRQLKAEAGADPGASEKRRQAAQRRSAEDIVRRAAEARRNLEKLQQEKARREKRHKKAEEKKREPRVSLTDPEARMMRFPDGAVRAAYNVQLAIVPNSGIILAAHTTDRRNDAGSAGVVVDQVTRRLGCPPQRVLADTHCATQQEIVDLAAKSIEVYTPVPADKPDASPESQRKRAWVRRHEPDAVKAWRARMADERSKEIYRRRSRIETVNAILKNRGLGVMRVRSMAKVACVVLLQVLAHNLWRAHCLRPA
jgi:transposase